MRWRAGRTASCTAALEVELNGKPFGEADAGVDMTFDFGTLIAHAAKTRALAAGTIIGSGTVSNRDADGGPGKPIADGGVGYSCLAEVRTVETLLSGAPKTPFLKAGDTVRIEMVDAKRHSIFGAIEQEVAAVMSADRSVAPERERSTCSSTATCPIGCRWRPTRSPG